MEATDYKEIIIPKVKKLLLELNKSHKWFNEQLFGLNSNGRAKNNFFRTDQKIHNYLIVSKAADLLGVLPDDLLKAVDSSLPSESHLRLVETLKHEDIIKQFSDQEWAKEVNMNLLDLERYAPEEKGYIKGLIEGIVRKSKPQKKPSNGI